MSYKVEKVNPYNPDRPKQEQVTDLFNAIAPVYDKMNGILSLGIDDYWRREALRSLRRYQPEQVLDLATGTGDLAIEAHRVLRPQRIIAADIAEEMMEVGRKKVLAKGLDHIISFERQASESMTFADNTFDAVISSFGVRNFQSIDQSFQEVLRVVKPGGIFLFLELTTPEQTPMKELYSFYTKHVMPTLSRFFTGNQKEYAYLPDSIAVFPQGREMMRILKKNGFRHIRLRRFTLGITTMYLAEK